LCALALKPVKERDAFFKKRFKREEGQAVPLSPFTLRIRDIIKSPVVKIKFLDFQGTKFRGGENNTSILPTANYKR